MQKKLINFLTVLLIANLMGCGDSQQNAANTSKTDTIANQNSAKKKENFS
jgi:hypothetical protein